MGDNGHDAAHGTSFHEAQHRSSTRKFRGDLGGAVGAPRPRQNSVSVRLKRKINRHVIPLCSIFYVYVGHTIGSYWKSFFLSVSGQNALAGDVMRSCICSVLRRQQQQRRPLTTGCVPLTFLDELWNWGAPEAPPDQDKIPCHLCPVK